MAKFLSACRGWVGVFALIGAFVPAIAAESKVKGSVRPIVGPIVAPSRARIAEIAQLLDDRPVAPGRPIADRPAWNQAAPSFPRGELTAEAKRIARTPPPKLTDEMYLAYLNGGPQSQFSSQYRAGFDDRVKRVGLLALAEGIENQGEFLPAIAREIDAILAEKTWVLPSEDLSLGNFHGTLVEVNLTVAMRGWTLATIDTWLGDRLPVELRHRLHAELRRRIIVPYLGVLHGAPRTDGFWWVTAENNWNAVCHAGVLGVALALGSEIPERAELLAAAEANLRFYFDGFPADGYCTEGLDYWIYGFGHAAMLAETVGEATGWRLRLIPEKPGRAVAAFPNDIEILPGAFPVFSDADYDFYSDPPKLAVVMRSLDFTRTLAERQFSGGTVGIVAPRMDFPALDNYWIVLYEAAYRAFLPHRAPHSLSPEPRHWFKSAQVLVSRAAPDFGAAIKGGHNDENHNHDDVGSFVVAIDHFTPLVDPGAEIYTARTFGPDRYQSQILSSYGHAVPLVAGQLQSTGRQFAARVKTADFTNETDRLVLDLSGAYRVPELRVLERTFEVRRGPNPTITVTDRVQFSSPQAFGTALITFERWREVSPGVLVIGRPGSAVRVEYSGKGGEVKLRAETIEEKLAGDLKPVRLGFDLVAPSQAATIELQIRPERDAGSWPSATGPGRALPPGGFPAD